MPHRRSRSSRIRAALNGRNIVLVGLMGAGKTSLGRRLAARLHLPFVDADAEIERAAAMTISDIFAKYGEAHFRRGEERVIARLLKKPSRVVATGGGAFMSAKTRRAIHKTSVSVWLKADLDTLLERVLHRSHRPLLQSDDPVGQMRRLIEARYPVYKQAHITVESRQVPHKVMLEALLTKLADTLDTP